ncbi:MAG: ATP-dependent DNA helicase [Alphaproteobacteria bacterium]|nr:ATP-dependent DNA helicase [Alphaproteobacteria bacterium]
MTADQAIPKDAPVSLPAVSAVVANARGCAILTDEGELLELSHAEARPHLQNKAALVCHAPFTKKRLGFEEFFTFDVLELFAFVHPTRFCVPTPVGLAKAVFTDVPQSFEDYPFALMDIARKLLADLREDAFSETADPAKIAEIMGLKGKGWPWAQYVFSALGQEYNPEQEIVSKTALNVWKHLPDWAEDAPEPPASHHGVSAEEAQERLAELLNVGDKVAELRPQQKDYTSDIAEMFAPMREDENPHIVLAEAGTGVGKTLGYLAPASVWAEKNEGSVWISTYTKNLQRQIDGELDRLYPHPQVKDAYVAIRKGRENYLCLLNLEEFSAGAALSYNPRHAVAAGIMARWVAATKDGDLSGADFSGWLAGLLGIGNTYGLADRRGECIFSACDHYNRCFVERSVRKAKRSRLVIANHALVMIQSAMPSSSEVMPTRYIFDEGHHLFDAADSAFSAHLTARETADLRRWLLGNEGNKKGRARGLKRRIEDLIEQDEAAMTALNEILHRANVLCAQGWSRRFKDDMPNGAAEQFLMHVYRVVFARAKGTDGPYSLETQLYPVDEDLRDASIALRKGLIDLLTPMAALAKMLHQRLVDDTGEMDRDIRRRIDALAISLERRGSMTLKGWIDMLETLEEEKSVDGFVDWLEIERVDGKSIDVGLYRHYVDPMKPFATSIRPHLHGMCTTSATLRDQTQDEKHNWKIAQDRTAAQYLSHEPLMSHYSSPFDYAKNTKVFIVDDVKKTNLDQVAAAYRALFCASQGGALGLFTAVQRLKAVHDRIALPLEEQGITLYGQHMDDMDTGTLIDIFRDDEHACLLGTDAVRDGVDVPGGSLRLLVFDRVPWPRPTILHKARRDAFGGRAYDEMMTRLKLKQAFGRLVRRADDRGIFVMLDSGLPTRLQSAFPEETEIIKAGLSDVIAEIRDFWK